VTPQQLHLQRNKYFQKVKNKFSKSTPSVNLTNENTKPTLNQAVMSLNKIEYNNTNSIFSNSSSSSSGDAINSNNNNNSKNKMNSINDKEIGN